jgi:hypothetical protein
VNQAIKAHMGVSYAYNLASTLYNDVEQRPEMVRQGLTRAGIEKVQSLHLRYLSAHPHRAFL